MASILICSSPTLGHIAPLTAVARHLVEAGHHVRFLTGHRYEDRVVATGAAFLPLPAEADLDIDNPDDAFPQRIGLTGLDAIKFDILNLFLTPAPAQVTAIDAALAAKPTDVVLTEPLFLGAGVLTTRHRATRPAVIGLGIVPLTLADPTLAPNGFGLRPMGGPLGFVRNRALTAVAERTFAPMFTEIRRMMAEQGIVGGPLGFDWLATTDAMAQFTVPAFEYPRQRMPDTVHFVGPVSRTIASTEPLPDWWSVLDDGKPVIHVTQGTVANRDLDQLTRPAIEGLAGLDAHVVVTTGGRALDTLGENLPANVLAAEFIPHDLLLPKTDVMVTNGGYGGVHMALRHGVPLVVAGKTEDKPEVAARVAWSGVGIDLRTNRPSAAAVAKAVRRVLADGKYRAAAQKIAEDIGASPGLDGVADLVAAHVAERA